MGRTGLRAPARSHRRDSSPGTERVDDPDRWRGSLSGLGGWLLFALVFWLLIAGRWGSYVGVPEKQLYVTEIALVYILSLALVSGPGSRARLLRVPARYAVPLVALMAWSAVRTLPGLSYGSDALRDLAPYAYAVVAVFAVVLTRPTRVRYSLLAGTIFHAAWVTPPLLVNAAIFADTEQLGRTREFEIRTDFDAVVAGVLAFTCFLIAMSLRRTVERLAFAAAGLWSATLVVLIGNRAGLLATAAVAGWSAMFVLRHSRRWKQAGRRHRRVFMVASFVVAGLLAAAILIFSPAGQRLGETFDDSGGGAGGRTASARVQVYRTVYHYLADSPSRLVVGVGMGPDFMSDSGAVAHYDPGERLGVRSPHNFALGTLARLGLIGALLQLAVVAGGYVLARRVLHEDSVDDLTRLAALLVVALPIAGAVGVVLESPFGAVPYFWSLGLLVSTQARRRGSTSEERDSVPTGQPANT